MLWLLEFIWFVAIVVMSVLTLKGQVMAIMAFIAFLAALGIHYFTNKGDPFIVNLTPLGAGFRMFVAEFILVLALMTKNIPLALLVLAYIPFEYFVSD